MSFMPRNPAYRQSVDISVQAQFPGYIVRVSQSTFGYSETYAPKDEKALIALMARVMENIYGENPERKPHFITLP